MSVCHVCAGRTPGTNLCRACTRVLEQAVAELPADLRDLQLVATRQATGPLGVNRYRQWDGPFENGSLGDAPWDYAPGPDDQIWALRNTVTTWVRHLCESRGITPPTPRTRIIERRLVIVRNRAHLTTVVAYGALIEQLAGWLLANLSAIAQDEAAAQIHDELTGLHEQNERWILGRRGLEVFAGRCDATQIAFEHRPRFYVERNRMHVEWDALYPLARPCGANLFGHDGEDDLRCPACGMTYRLAERLATMHRTQIDDQLARAFIIADALTTLERPLGRDRLRKWVERDAHRPAAQDGPACLECDHPTCRAIRRPPIHARGMDDDGHPLYRIGDVRRRLAALSDRIPSRRSA